MLTPPLATHAILLLSNYVAEPHANPTYSTLSPNSLLTIGLDNASESHKARVIKILDSPKFHKKPAINLIPYKNWLLQVKNKLRANKSYMPTEFYKMSYIQSLVANNALVQISTQIGDNAMWSFTTVKEMFDVLTARFNNLNEKKKARSVYRSLRQGTRDFNFFWIEFQKLSQLLNYSNETLIADLIKKVNALIQRQLSTGKHQPTNFLKLAERYQCIENLLKITSHSQFIQDQNSERIA